MEATNGEASRRELLLAAARALAMEPEAQLAYLAALKMRVGVDELALQFDDISRAATDMCDRGEISGAALDATRALALLLDAMSGAGNARLWTDEALSGSPEWAGVRRRAKRLVTAIQAA